MDNSVQCGTLDSRIKIHLPDNRMINAVKGTDAGSLLRPLTGQGDSQIVAALVNGELKDLSVRLERDSEITPIRINTPEGMRIYRRSLLFVLEAAFEELFPEGELTVSHAVYAGGYLCQVKKRQALSPRELQNLKERMREMIARDLPLERKSIPLAEARRWFAEKQHTDKLLLLKDYQQECLDLHFLGEHRSFYLGHMVPSTGYLQRFDIEGIKSGFTLRFPRRYKPHEILPLGANPKLLEAFRLYGDWLEMLDFQNVGELNDAVREERIREVILLSEALHEQSIADMASHIAANRDELRLVLIAGPSSSGKTTTARRLSLQLLAHGIQTVSVEMDNYFVDLDKTPRDEKGDYDFDHVDALDKTRFNRDLNQLIAGESVRLPKYDFQSCTSGPGEMLALKPGQIIIIEGIHGLNPVIVRDIPARQVFRVYISALTQLNLDRIQRVSTSDTRLIRRIVRDARKRGHSAQTTLSRWDGVKRGEKRNIFPYQENADVIFNSALVYELSALKPLVEPLLQQIPFGQPEHIEAQRLLKLLEWFLPVSPGYIPDKSLLREFIGDSFFQEFTLRI